jgi:transcriptional regulator with XRE-family HTH domain
MEQKHTFDRELIKRLRENRGWSFAQAAKAAGWPPGARGKWEKVEAGEHFNPAFATLCGIADALQVPVDALRLTRPADAAHWALSGLLDTEAGRDVLRAYLEQATGAGSTM